MLTTQEKERIDTSEYDNYIANIADKLSNGDKFLSEELRSEMYIRLLRMMKTPVTFSKDVDRIITLSILRRRAKEYLMKKSGQVFESINDWVDK
jgi:hypothetical protein